MARQFVPYTIDSFIGGITDKVVKPSNPVQYETLKNLIPQRDESLRQRDGFKLWDNMAEDLDILQMFEFQGFIFYYCSDKRFYYIANSGTGTPAIVKTELDSSTYTATSYDGSWHISECNGELILTHNPDNKTPDPYVSPRTSIKRLYINELGNPVICTNQLPMVTESTFSFTFDSDDVNTTNETISTHTDGTLEDGDIVTFTGSGLPAPLVADFEYYVTVYRVTDNDYIKLSLYPEDQVVGTFIDLTSTGTAGINHTAQVRRPMFRNLAGYGDYQLFFIIYWQYSYTILVDKTPLEKLIYGEPFYGDIPSTGFFSISWRNFDYKNVDSIGIVDSNFGDNEIWDTTNIKLVIAAKSVYPSGTVIPYGIFDDDLLYPEFTSQTPSSSPLIKNSSSGVPYRNGEPFFNQGENDQQSLILGSFYNTEVDGIVYYGNTGNGSNRVYQAVEDAPYWTNLFFFVEFPRSLTGLDNYSSKAIAFSSDRVYRIEGQKSQDGSGSLYYRTISDSHGCIAGNSIVKTQYGLFFWSKSGIFICDGIKANRISDSLQARYKSWVTTDTQKNAIRGWYDDEEDKVYWVVQESDGHTFLLVLDLYFGVSSESVFYVIDSDHSYWNITDGMLNSYDNKILIAGNEFIYQPDPSYTYDALSGYVSSAVVGLNVPIKYDYKSPVITYNDKLGRKWTSHIVLNMKDSDSAAGVSTRIRSYADLSANPHYLDPCFYYQEMYSDDQEWGNIDPVWGESQRPIFKRYFDQSTVRNTFIQIGFDNLKIVKYTDADYEKATYVQTMDGSDPVRYLLLPTTLFTSSPITGNEALDGSWYIKLEEDDYETEYAVTSIEANATFLQINLPADTELTSGTLTQSNHGWKLCQISKEHRFHLLSYSLLYTPMGHRTIPGYQTEKMNGE